MTALQRQLWTAASEAVRADPTGTAPRLYVETLNSMIDVHTSRVASLRNRVPGTVVLLQVFGSAVALGVLSLYLTLLGRSEITSLAASVVVVFILIISFDLDRPERGLITVPAHRSSPSRRRWTSRPRPRRRDPGDQDRCVGSFGTSQSMKLSGLRVWM